MKITKRQLRKLVREGIDMFYDDPRVQKARADEFAARQRMVPGIQKRSDANVGKLVKLTEPVIVRGKWSAIHVPVVIRVDSVKEVWYSRGSSWEDPGAHATYIGTIDLSLSPPLEEVDWVQEVRTPRARARRVAFLTAELDGKQKMFTQAPANHQLFKFYNG